ncbi:MAG TPA: metal-dependent transcriptional regulator [Candidatus Thermoplasmatota archaeon]|nr:metal-dependent transcriptional regulator [Candidatus Thermoplasmatota archaeon]
MRVRGKTAGAEKTASPLSENVEMYLETVFVLTEQGGRARTTDVAHGWRVAPSSATEMIQRLAGAGYLEYEPYHGVELTAKGLTLARGVVRKHRLLETFLTREVGLKGPRVAEYACEMEHVLPEEVERWMCATLGHPTESPLGGAIPPGACCARARR